MVFFKWIWLQMWYKYYPIQLHLTSLGVKQLRGWHVPLEHVLTATTEALSLMTS
jgi:hypothetical protein